MPEQPPTLRDMVKQAASNGLTYEQLAQRARKRGAGTSGSYLNNIALGNVPRMPTPENLRGIAWAIDVPYERVRQAAILQWYPPEDAADTADDIPPERRELLEKFEALRAAILTERPTAGDSDPGREGGAA